LKTFVNFYFFKGFDLKKEMNEVGVMKWIGERRESCNREKKKKMEEKKNGGLTVIFFS